MLREIQKLWRHDRSVIEGFDESDAPNFSFATTFSFTAGTKALGEEVCARAITSTFGDYGFRLILSTSTQLSLQTQSTNACMKMLTRFHTAATL